MKYPEYLFPAPKMGWQYVDKAYQEFMVRMYYHDNTDETDIPATVPVEHVEDYFIERLSGPILWVAKGFATARNVDAGDNLDFRSDCQFHMFCLYCARLYFKKGIENNWFDENISEEDFCDHCHAFNRNEGGINL